MLPNITDYHQIHNPEASGQFATLTNRGLNLFIENDLHFASGMISVVYKMQNNGRDCS
jgi:hypothetical protein